MYLNLSNNPKKMFLWIVIHMVIGVLSSISAFVLVAWLYYSILWFLSRIITGKIHRELYMMSLLCYVSSFDVIGRMAKAYPFIPYELSKYFLPPMLLYGIFLSRKSWNRGLFMLLLLIPAFFYDLSGSVTNSNLIFFGLGPLSLCLSIAYFINKKMSLDMIMICLRMFLYSSIMVLSFAFFKTPSYDQISFSLGANFSTTGGFGSNQVANILGLGIFIISIKLILRHPISGNRWVDLGLLGLFLFQALLTFSRGGIFNAILSILSFVILLPSLSINAFGKKLNKNALILLLLVFGILGYAIFSIADDITGSQLSLRYSGETVGTLSGAKEKDFSTLSSNRFDIILGELQIWKDNFISGVGVGASLYLIENHFSSTVSSHTEFSRLLAEHGVLGLIFLLIWLSIYYKINKSNIGLQNALLKSFFIFAFLISLHSAMRIFITPIFVGLSSTTIIRRNTSIS